MDRKLATIYALIEGRMERTKGMIEPQFLKYLLTKIKTADMSDRPEAMLDPDNLERFKKIVEY